MALAQSLRGTVVDRKSFDACRQWHVVSCRSRRANPVPVHHAGESELNAPESRADTSFAWTDTLAGDFNTATKGVSSAVKSLFDSAAGASRVFSGAGSLARRDYRNSTASESRSSLSGLLNIGRSARKQQTQSTADLLDGVLDESDDLRRDALSAWDSSSTTLSGLDDPVLAAAADLMAAASREEATSHYQALQALNPSDFLDAGAVDSPDMAELPGYEHFMMITSAQVEDPFRDAPGWFESLTESDLGQLALGAMAGRSGGPMLDLDVLGGEIVNTFADGRAFDSAQGAILKMKDMDEQAGWEMIDLVTQINWPGVFDGPGAPSGSWTDTFDPLYEHREAYEQGQVVGEYGYYAIQAAEIVYEAPGLLRQLPRGLRAAREGGLKAWNALKNRFLTRNAAPKMGDSAKSFEKGFIDDFVDGTVSQEQLETLRKLGKHFENPNGYPLEIVTEQDVDGYSQRLHQILLQADDSHIPRGTMAEEVQHAIDKSAGLYDDRRLANGLPKLKEKFGEHYNTVWHAQGFERIADGIETGWATLNILFEPAEADAFRRAAAELWRRLAEVGITH